jgi:hypothetical protein
MNIVKPKWQWKWKLTPIKKKDITGMALHHSGSNTASKYDIDKMHKNKKWNGYAYNWGVTLGGEVYEGRGWNVGGGLKGLLLNRKTISILFEGNYHPDPRIPFMKEMPDVQFKAGVELITTIAAQLPNLKKLGGHKEFNATLCPGDNFPLARMVIEVKKARK